MTREESKCSPSKGGVLWFRPSGCLSSEALHTSPCGYGSISNYQEVSFTEHSLHICQTATLHQPTPFLSITTNSHEFPRSGDSPLSRHFYLLLPICFTSSAPLQQPNQKGTPQDSSPISHIHLGYAVAQWIWKVKWYILCFFYNASLLLLQDHPQLLRQGRMSHRDEDTVPAQAALLWQPSRERKPYSSHFAAFNRSKQANDPILQMRTKFMFQKTRPKLSEML